jgi:riboflavin kinase/FMN adenylyltransferase
MLIVSSSAGLPDLKYPVVTSGTFDGVHFGHQKILRDVVGQAKAQDGESVVITYWPHPRFVLGKSPESLRLLSTFEEKAELIAQCGIDYLVKIPFTRAFSQLSADEYIHQVIVEGMHAKKLVLGYDHKFGKNQEGSFNYLKSREEVYGFKVEEIPRQDLDEVGVSSTKIRVALEQGDVHLANEYLGRSYSLTGIVTKGEQIGRRIGFPTANIYVPEEYKLIPSDGVYAVLVQLGSRTVKGMLNIGKRPTVSGQTKTIEVNMFNFDEDIYGRTLTVVFVGLLRKEKKFSGLEALQAQLRIDQENAVEWLENL